MAYTNGNMREDIADIVRITTLQSLAENVEGSLKNVFTDQQHDDLITQIARVRFKMTNRLIQHLKNVPD